MSASATSSQNARSYDWMIWGHEPYGILAGCLAQRLGCRVLIVKDEASRAWSRRTAFNAQNIEFGTGAILSFQEGDGTSEVLRQLVSRIFPEHPLSDLKERLNLKSTFASVCTTDYRLPIHANVADLQEEWRWEVGPAGDLEPFFKRMQFFEWQSFVARVLGERMRIAPEVKGAKLPAEARFANRRAFFDGVHYALVDAESGAAHEREFIRVLSTCREQLFHENGRLAIAEGLLELASAIGVEVVSDVAVERMDVEGGKVRRVHLSDGQTIQVENVLAQRSLNELKKVCKKAMPIVSRKLKTPLKPMGWRFCTGLTLQPDFMPPMLGYRMVWKEPDAPVISLEVMKAGEVSLSTILPFEEQTLDPAYQGLIMARMFRLVTEVFPFVEYYLVRMFPDFREGTLPDEMREVYAFESLDAIPGNLLYFPHSGMKPRPKGHESGIRNLYLCSQEAHPSLGQYGTMLSAFESVFAGIARGGKEAEQKIREWIGESFA